MFAHSFYDSLPKALTVDLYIQSQILEVTQKFSTLKCHFMPIKYENPSEKHRTAT